MEKIKLQEPFQISIVVKDVDQTIEYFKTLGMGPFITRVYESKSEALLYGKPLRGKIRRKLGFTNLGKIQIELVQPLEGDDPVFTEHLKEKGDGVNHIAFRVADVGKEVERWERLGIKCLYSDLVKTETGSVRGHAYMDTKKIGGVIFELLGGV